MNNTDPHAAPASYKSALERAGRHALAEHTRLEGCEIIGLIGAGDFSIVYLAYDYALARQVAVKEYLPASIATRGANGQVTVPAPADRALFDLGLRSFLSEARLLAGFNAASLVRILRFWQANGTAYISMPFYDGVKLEDAVGSGRFDANEKRVRQVLAALCDAVEPLHRVHCYHPDISSCNILLLPDGRPLLLDFGAARRVVRGHAEGAAAALRPGFAPVEDYEDIPNLKRGPWTDVYALGAVGYFLMTGKAPPPATARMADDRMTPARQAGAARYSESFLAGLDQALAVMPQQRTQSIADLRRALGLTAQGDWADNADFSTLRAPETQAGHAHHAHPAHGGGVSPWRTSRRPGMKTAALGLAVFALVAAAGFWGVRRAEPPAAGVQSAAPPVAAAGKAAEMPSPAPAPAAAPALSPAPAPTAGRTAERPASAAEESRWNVASSLNNASAYENYLAEYPNGRYAPLARATLENLRAAANQGQSIADPALQEESLWNAVRKIDKPLAYESFLRKYPSGRYASAARSSLARLRPALPETRPAFEPPVVDASRRPDVGIPATRQPGLPAAAAPTPAATPLASAPAAQERVATARPQSTPAPAAAAPQAADAAADVEAEQEAPSASVPVRERRTLRLANQVMTGNFSPDPVSGLISGTGRIVWDNGDQFDGTMVRGQKEGRGEFRWSNGQRYQGDWSRDQPNGKGSIRFPNGDRYTGDVRNGLPNGTGTLVFANGNRYQGDVRDGQPNGSGVLTFGNGNRYRGEVKDGLPNGTGTNRYANGDVYTGSWRRGKSDGQGRYTWANGNYWEGEFRDDAKTANGRMSLASDAPNGAVDAPRGSTANGGIDEERGASATAR